MSRLRGTFEVELPVHSLFETPTIANLSVTVIQKQAQKVEHKNIALILAELEGLEG